MWTWTVHCSWPATAITDSLIKVERSASRLKNSGAKIRSWSVLAFVARFCAAEWDDIVPYDSEPARLNPFTQCCRGACPKRLKYRTPVRLGLSQAKPANRFVVSQSTCRQECVGLVPNTLGHNRSRLGACERCVLTSPSLHSFKVASFLRVRPHCCR